MAAFQNRCFQCWARFRLGRCRRIYAAVALAMALTWVAWPQGALAQTVLVPVLSNPAGLDLTRAEGAVIWSHGRAVDVEDSLAPTPDYILAMARAGWDTYRLNRMRQEDTLPRSGAALAHEAERLKAAGYRRVVLAGQSFGGFISLIAAGQTDVVDAVIATAPAAFGNSETNYDTFRLNATRLYDLLEDVRRARVALAFFNGDIFDPGGRGERAEAILSARGLPHLIIDQPARLSSHWAANTAEFTRRFSLCFIAFAEGNVPHLTGDCDRSEAQRIADIR